MPLPPITQNGHAYGPKRGPLDEVMLKLVEQATEDGLDNLLNIRWHELKYSTSTKRAINAISEALNIPLNNEDAELITSHFRHYGLFDYKAFLNAFRAYHDYHHAQYKLPRISSTSTVSTIDSVSSTPRLTPHLEPLQRTPRQHWHYLQHRANLATVTQKHLITAVEDHTLQRAAEKIEEAILRRIVNKIPDAQLLLGNIKLNDLKNTFKSNLGVELSQLEVEALFRHLDENGDGVISTREVMNFLHSMTIRIRKRLVESDVRHRRRDPIINVYNRAALNRCIVLLIRGMQDGVSLNVPEKPLTQEEILKYIDLQLHVTLTPYQVQCLCHKLNAVDKKKMNKREFLRSYSTEIKTSDKDGEVMGMGSVRGELLNAFYGQLKKYMG